MPGHSFNFLARVQLRFKMRLSIVLLSFVALLLACPSNKEDTCQPLGDTFASVELDSTAAVASLSLRLFTLDTLPAAYYAEATLIRLQSDQNGNPFENIASGSSINLATSDSLNIELPPPATTARTVGLSIRYRDRREFISCEHPGSGDQYVLFLFFTYLPDGRIEDFSWEEDFRPGGF